MTKSARLHRNRRAASPPPMRLTARDLALVQMVAALRIARQDQLQALFFGSRSTAQSRLSPLYQHGFLARHFLPVYVGWSPALYTLDSRGVAALRAAGISASAPLWTTLPGHEFLAHTLAINDVRVAVTLACRTPGYALRLWRSDAELKTAATRVSVRSAQGHATAVVLIPDSYFVLDTPRGTAAFFLELDRGTMTLRRFQTKIAAYRTYVGSGQYERQYQTRSLRVLTIAPTAPRGVHLKQATEQAGGDRLFWFALHSDISAATVLQAAIWRVAGSEAAAALIPSG